MFYYLYEIKNLINDKIYVGVHKTKNINDGYMGSGKVILRAIQKSGIENFTKTILETFENSEAMFAREKEVVTDEFLARSDVYNLRRGGFGGFDYINHDTDLLRTRSKIARKNTDAKLKAIYGDDWRSVLGKIAATAASFPENLKKRVATRKIKGIRSDASYMHSPEVNEKRKATLKKIGHQQGTKNNSFGKIWITDGNVSKQIMKTEVIPIGWRKGRTGNFTNTRYKI